MAEKIQCWDIMSETELVYKCVYLSALKIIKEQVSSFVNNISDKYLFKSKVSIIQLRMGK